MSSSEEEPVRYRTLRKDDPHYTAVGRVASAWASFEFEVERAIWELAEITQSRGACITAQIFSISTLFKAYIALAELEGATEAQLTKARQMLIKEVTPIGERRNRVVHDPWVQAKATGKIHQLRATADRKLDCQFKERSMETIDAVWRDITQLHYAFKDLADEIYTPIRSERSIRNALRDAAPPPEAQ